MYVVDSLIQGIQNEARVHKDESIGQDMAAVLSLDNGTWSPRQEDLSVGIIRQPVPPPVLARIQPDYHPISPSRVADPRPGPAKPSENGKDGIQNPNSYQHLHIVGFILSVSILLYRLIFSVKYWG